MEDVEDAEELLDAELEQLRSKVQAEASRIEDLRCVLVSVREESEPTTTEAQAVESEGPDHTNERERERGRG